MLAFNLLLDFRSSVVVAVSGLLLAGYSSLSSIWSWHRSSGCMVLGGEILVRHNCLRGPCGSRSTNVLVCVVRPMLVYCCLSALQGDVLRVVVRVGASSVLVF